MLQTNNIEEDKLTPALKSVAYFSTGSLFIAGLVLLLDYALLIGPYARFYDYWSLLIFAHFIYEFCFSIIAFVLLSLEKISQSLKFIRFIVATILSLAQFVTALVGGSYILNEVALYYKSRPARSVYPEDKFIIGLCVLAILMSFIAGLSFSWWTYRVRQTGLRTNINSYSQV